MTVQLHTPRLRISEFTVGDAEFIVRLLNDSDFIRHIADRGVRTLDEARQYLADGPIASYRRHGFGLWRVALRAEDTPVGMAGLVSRDFLDCVDLGYALLPGHRGQGIALEAARAVMAYATGTLGLVRVLAIVSCDNPRSIALLEKLAFRYAGKTRHPGDPAPLALYEHTVGP